MFNIRQNVIRAVRVLPEAVRVGSSVSDMKNIDHAEKNEVKKQPDELSDANGKINLLQSQIGLLNNRLKEAVANYDELSVRCVEMEDKLKNRESELQAEMKKKLEAERGKVISEAEADAAKILADAEKIRSESQNKGYTEGFEKGKENGLEKAISDAHDEYSKRFSGLVDLLEKAHSEVEANLGSLVQMNEARLLRLWQGTLTAMLNREVQLNSETARIVLEGVLNRVSDKNRLVIYLSPSDIEKVEDEKSEMTEQLRGARHIDFMPDSRVEPGSCIVETNLGVYDARWKTQMDQIEGEISDLYRAIPAEQEDSGLDQQNTDDEL